MQLERTRIDGHEYWVLRDDKGIAAMAETREALLPAPREPEEGP